MSILFLHIIYAMIFYNMLTSKNKYGKIWKRVICNVGGVFCLYIDFKSKGKLLVVELSGELDHHSAQEVRTKIDDRLDRQDIKKLIFDFSEVSFMDSSGIGVIIGRYKKLSIRNGVVVIANVSGSIKRIFELSGIFKIIKVYKSVDEAIAKL